VEKFKSVPPFPETRNYVDQVGRRYEAERAAAEAKAAPKPSATGKPAEASAAMPMPVPASEEEPHPKLESLVDQNGRLSLKTSP
jgi:hypothetical protein